MKRSSRKAGVCLVVALAVCLAAGAGPAGAKTSKTVRVDCAKGDSIRSALADKSDELLIEIAGLCVEDVDITRPATVRGADPLLDGISAADPQSPLRATVRVRDVDLVRFENLRLTGSGNGGLRALDSRIEMDNCRLEGNGSRGATFIDTGALLTNTVVTGNGAAAGSLGIGLIASNSGVVCDGCTISSNASPVSGWDVGFYMLSASSGTFTNGSISGWIAAATDRAGQLNVVDSTLTAVLDGAGFGWSIYADTNTRAVVRRTTLDGSIIADNMSQLLIAGSTQTRNDSLTGNTVGQNSYLTVGRSGSPSGPVDSTLIGSTFINRFSGADFTRQTALGDLGCDPTANAQCSDDTTINGTRGGSSCSLCQCTDGDGDGFFLEGNCPGDPDCDDGDSGTNPGAAEVCADGLDNNCDGQSDEGCP